jgi:hypothetical protein
MEQAQGQAFRRFGVLALVLSGHVLLVILFSSSRPSDTDKGPARTEPRAVLMLLNLESRAKQPPLEQTPETPSVAGASRTRADRARKPSGVAPIEPRGEASKSTAINSDEVAVTPKIDWQREMETAVETVTPEMIKEWLQLCARAERAHAPRPPGCNRRSYEGPWRPSGNLLKDMYDLDRPPSSVPDPLPEAFPKAPRSEAFQKQE